MPIHLDDIDVLDEVAGLDSVLIVPCNMCPAVTVAVNEQKPFLRLFRNPLKSSPFEDHIESLRAKLTDMGVKASVFRSPLPHQWFVCMWTSGRRWKLREAAKKHDAVIVMGCDTATETVRDAVRSTDCKVIEGMEVTAFMNAKMTFRLNGDVGFDDCRMVPIARRRPAS